MRKLMLLPVAVVALATAGPALADDVAVRITSSGFTPAAAKAQNGDRIVWTNNDTRAHQIVADDGSFRSDALAPGDRFSYVFRSGGTFAYHDATRPAMKGTVVVESTRSVTIDAHSRVVTFNGSVLLSGTVASGKAGEQVVIRQKARGSNVFLRVGTVATTANGEWQLRVQPRRNTLYDAVWNNVRSDAQQVLVKPLVKLKQTGRRSFAVAVHAQTRLRFHVVNIQRWKLKQHRWVTIRRTTLRFFRAAARENVSTATFRMRVRHGTIIRAFISRNQAGPAYTGPAWSRALRA